MSTSHDNPGMAIIVAQATPAYLLITAFGTLCGLDAINNVIGSTTDTVAIGKPSPVRFSSAGTSIMTASIAIAIGDPVYKAAAGQITNVAAGSVQVGIALEAASAAGQFIEVKWKNS